MALVHAPATGVRFSDAEARLDRGGKSAAWKTTGCCIEIARELLRGGDIGRELLLRFRGFFGAGEGLNPTAQSGRGGNGCCDDVVDVYVRRDDDDVVEDD